MKSPDKKVLQALTNLEHSSDWHTVLDWILASANEQDIKLRVAESLVSVHRAQGAGNELRDLADKAVKARNAVRKLTTPMPDIRAF